MGLDSLPPTTTLQALTPLFFFLCAQVSAVRDRKVAQAEAGPRAEMMGQVQFISTFSMKVWKKLKEHVDPKKVLIQLIFVNIFLHF